MWAKKAADSVRALRNQVRRDIGRFPSLCGEAGAALTTQYHAHRGWTAAQNENTVLDEKLYFQVFNTPTSIAPRRAAGAR